MQPTLAPAVTPTPPWFTPWGCLQVLKEFRHIGDKANSIERYNKVLSSHTVASFLAGQFNLELERLEGIRERLEYLEPSVVRSWDSGKEGKGNVAFNRWAGVGWGKGEGGRGCIVLSQVDEIPAGERRDLAAASHFLVLHWATSL